MGVVYLLSFNEDFGMANGSIQLDWREVRAVTNECVPAAGGIQFGSFHKCRKGGVAVA